MMLKTIMFLFFVAVCTAIPLNEAQDVGDVQPTNQDPQVEVKEDGSDLKTESSYWGGYGGIRGYGGIGGFGFGGYYGGYPGFNRRSFSYYPYHRPRYYQYYQPYPTYYNSYW